MIADHAPSGKLVKANGMGGVVVGDEEIEARLMHGRGATPRVSIVVVTWNRRDEILAGLNPLTGIDYPDFEVVVVDNGSTDGTAEAVAEHHPDVNLVSLETNVGPTGGRNAGVRAADGQIIFFLDSDMDPGSETVEQVVKRFDADPTVGAIACKIVNADPDERAGWAFNPDIDRDREFSCLTFSEGAVAFRRTVFEELGGFWEKLFFGREGEELALRVWDAGYRVLYYPTASVRHRGSNRSRIVGSEREYLQIRNCYFIYLTRYPPVMMIQFMVLKSVAATARSVMNRSFRATAWRAMAETTRRLPELWDERDPISPETAVLYRRMSRDHGPLSWDLRSWVRHKRRPTVPPRAGVGPTAGSSS